VFDPLNEQQYQWVTKRYVVWAIERENPSSHLTCRWVPRKWIWTKIFIWPEAPMNGFHQILHNMRCGRSNQLGKFWRLVKRRWFYGESKIVYSYRLSQSLLIQSSEAGDGWPTTTGNNVGHVPAIVPGIRHKKSIGWKSRLTGTSSKPSKRGMADKSHPERTFDDTRLSLRQLTEHLKNNQPVSF